MMNVELSEIGRGSRVRGKGSSEFWVLSLRLIGEEECGMVNVELSEWEAEKGAG